MMNNVELNGTVRQHPVRTSSPAGIPHCQFWLEHHSRRLETQRERKVYCCIPVVASGETLSKETQHLILGSVVTVEGFIAYQKNKQGIGKVVLHADRVHHIVTTS